MQKYNWLLTWIFFYFSCRNNKNMVTRNMWYLFICLYFRLFVFFQLNAIFFFNLQQDLLQGKCKKMRKLFIDVIKEDRTRRVYCCHFGLLMKPGNRLTIMVLCPISVCTCAHCVCKCLYMYNLNACSVRTGKHNETL